MSGPKINGGSVMKKDWYSLEDVAGLLDSDIDSIKQSIVRGDLRVAVFALGWWGMWMPQRENGEYASNFGVVDIDQSAGVRVRTFHGAYPDGETVTITETTISKMWYLAHSDAVELLMGKAESIERSALEPLKKYRDLPQDVPESFTEKGFFWLENGQASIREDDLIIPAEELDRIRSDISGSATPPSTVRAEKDCRNWLEDLMRSQKKVKTKNEYRLGAMDKFEGLGDRAFDRAWNDAIKATGALSWSKPGPMGG